MSLGPERKVVSLLLTNFKVCLKWSGSLICFPRTQMSCFEALPRRQAGPIKPSRRNPRFSPLYSPKSDFSIYPSLEDSSQCPLRYQEEGQVPRSLTETQEGTEQGEGQQEGPVSSRKNHGV